MRSVPADTGLVTLPEFLVFWSGVFVITTAILAFKHEEKDEEQIEGVFETYKLLYSVLKLDIVKQWVVIVLTCKVSFAAVDAVSGLKILDAGVPKEKMALLAVPLTPIQIILPIILAPYTTGKEPLNLWLRSYLPRLIMGGVITILVWFTPSLLQVSVIIVVFIIIFILREESQARDIFRC